MTDSKYSGCDNFRPTFERSRGTKVYKYGLPKQLGEKTEVTVSRIRPGA